MNQYVIADRYARALSASLADTALLDEQLAELRAVHALLAEDGTLKAILDNPAVLREKRLKILLDVLEQASVSTLIRNFLRVLFLRERLGLLHMVIEVFSDMVDKRLNRVTARVKSAVPLEDRQQERLKAQLSRYCGKAVQLDCAVDEDILGGVVARMGSLVVDGSVQTRLEHLQRVLLTASN